MKDGKYSLIVGGLPPDCQAITDKILLWTLELENISAGTSDIFLRVDFGENPAGAIVPGGVGCEGQHSEDADDGYAEITTSEPEPEPIPTLSEWGMIIFMFVIMGTGVMVLRKRRVEGLNEA